MFICGDPFLIQNRSTNALQSFTNRSNLLNWLACSWTVGGQLREAISVFVSWNTFVVECAKFDETQELANVSAFLKFVSVEREWSEAKAPT